MKRLFRQFQTLKKPGDTDGMRPIVQAACKALAIHALIEEEIFYPALRENTEATDALAEASVEHHHVKELVMKLGSSAPGDDLFAARVTVLSEYVEHHVKEEEGTLFAKARRARFDLVALGDQLQARKDELEQRGPTIDIEALAARHDASARRNVHRTRR